MTTLTTERKEMVNAVALMHRELDEILRIIVAELCSGQPPLTLALSMELMRLDIAERLTNLSTTIALGEEVLSENAHDNT